MNSVRTVPVSLALIENALEHYWRSNALIKENEHVKVQMDLGTCEAKITTQEVEVFRYDG